MNKLVIHLKVRASKIDGNGLFACSSISARKKIGELEGEIISVRAARNLAKKTKRIAIVEFDSGYAMYASNNQSVFKYINHSCAPNTYMRVINHRVEFYSLREININEELTCNYGETHHDGKLKCNCNLKNCSRYL